MTYKEQIRNFIDKKIEKRNSILDIASGPKFRHAIIYQDLFNRVYANNLKIVDDKIEALLNDNPELNVYWGNFSENKRKI